MSEIENLSTETVKLELKDITKDIEEALEELDPDSDETKLITCDFLSGKKNLRLKIKGTLTTRGIVKKTSTFGTNHSMGLELSSEAMDNLNELVEMIHNVKGVTEAFDVKNIFFKGKWYPKVKVDADNKNRFQCATVPRMNPTKPNEELGKGDEVLIDTDVGAWFSIGHKALKAGIYFNFNKLVFTIDEEVTPPKKRSKKE